MTEKVSTVVSADRAEKKPLFSNFGITQSNGATETQKIDTPETGVTKIAFETETPMIFSQISVSCSVAPCFK